MAKRLLILLTAVMSLSASVYAAGWIKEFIPGDEVWDIAPYNKYTYSDNIGFLYFDDKTVAFELQTYRANFVIESDSTGTEYIVCVLLIYDKDKQLMEKQRIHLRTHERDEDVALSDSDAAWTEQIYNYLLLNEGYVRFVIHRTRGKDYDLEVPCIKTYLQNQSSK